MKKSIVPGMCDKVCIGKLEECKSVLKEVYTVNMGGVGICFAINKNFGGYDKSDLMLLLYNIGGICGADFNGVWWWEKDNAGLKTRIQVLGMMIQSIERGEY